MKIAVTLLTCCLILQCAVSQSSVRPSFVRFDKVYGHLKKLKKDIDKFVAKFDSATARFHTKWKTTSVDALKLKMDQTGRTHLQKYEDIRAVLGLATGEMMFFALVFETNWNWYTHPTSSIAPQFPLAPPFIKKHTSGEYLKYHGVASGQPLVGKNQQKRSFLRCLSQYLIAKKDLLNEATKIESSFDTEITQFYQSISPTNWAVWQKVVEQELATSKSSLSKIADILNGVPSNEGAQNIDRLQDELESALKQASRASGTKGSGPMGKELLDKFKGLEQADG